MARAIGQIEQEIAVLDQTVEAIAQAFYDAYQEYLTVLGQAVRRQLVLAAYHICTHSYPEQFTSLTLSQRQTLQQALRQLAQQAKRELIESLYPVAPPDEDPKLLNSARSEATAEPTAAPSTHIDLFAAFGQSAESEPPDDLPPDDLPPDNLPEDSEASSPAQPDDALDADAPRSEQLRPRDIARWQSALESEILEVLQTISHATNQVLQQAKILPDRLPEPILEVAAKADLSSEAASGPPNLMNLLIESEDEERSSESVTQIVAVRLRLSEIEFGDAPAATGRLKLRHLLTQLSKLGREYRHRQKERAVAQAEAAWRSSWFDEAE
ncbi:MAG: hypothetical protein KME07_22595 [Pegethrix bostrychoides GSE-TBD4-15B]|jgi:hypothetical protein|uniref:Uncharacterized protein n=1 Tax=Pegethrix bostrychoides GSE-TBD4-15B TaxID=2839662 RepID=A0A951U749_9CYAN|nr:hypothetical protein [Pegethrix bostrychoides GSE-TBD4-15B]